MGITTPMVHIILLDIIIVMVHNAGIKNKVSMVHIFPVGIRSVVAHMVAAGIICSPVHKLYMVHREGLVTNSSLVHNGDLDIIKAMVHNGYHW